MAKRRLALAVTPMLALLASACAGGSASERYVRNPSAQSTRAPATSAPFRAPQVMRGSGLESVIGLAANSLTNRFGEARIDLAEGDARKLQFVSEGCVLDIYLYPLETGSVPVATHVEARQRQGGGAADRAGCIADVELAANTR